LLYSFIGRLFVKALGKPSDILAILNEMAGFSTNEEIELYEVSAVFSFFMTTIGFHIHRNGCFLRCLAKAYHNPPLPGLGTGYSLKGTGGGCSVLYDYAFISLEHPKLRKLCSCTHVVLCRWLIVQSCMMVNVHVAYNMHFIVLIFPT
jgi:hypothetical protein